MYTFLNNGVNCRYRACSQSLLRLKRTRQNMQNKLRWNTTS